jgi:hypothetical protein
MYRPLTLSVTIFLNHLRHFLSKMPTSCPTTKLGDFNINILNQNSFDIKELQHFMKFYYMCLQFHKNKTTHDSQIDRVWTNVPTQQYIFGVLEAYLTDHKSIYFAFKIPNYVPQYRHVNYFFCSNTKAKTMRLASCLI